jgi:hypothetical protein
MSRNILDSAAGGAFMGNTIVEAKAILESILQNYSQRHTERAPMTSKKVSSIEEVDILSNKMDTILAYINKQNVENVPLHELVGNNAESVDVNFVRNLGNNGYGNNYNSYNKPRYASNNYGNRPFIPYPNANENKWKPTINDHSGGQQETNRNLMEQVAENSTMMRADNHPVGNPKRKV